MEQNTLIEFRVTYMRAIAKAWSDPTFKASLLKWKRDDTKDHPLKELGFNPRDHWPKLEVEFVETGGTWKPHTTGGWYSSGEVGETLTLRLPLDPAYAFPKNDKGQWTEALAGFYQRYPTLFGTKDKGLDTQSYLTDLGSTQPFFDFAGVIVRALALAWNDELFRGQLTENAANALLGWLGYTFPWGIPLKIVPTTKPQWVCRSRKKGTYFDWDHLEPNTLTLAIPQKPNDSDPMILPIALAAYNNTGPAYPFTCCI